MKTIDTCGQKLYSPLIPAVKAMCEATLGEKLEIIMNDTAAFNDLKEYLAEQQIGFREIYDGEQMTVQFTKNKLCSKLQIIIHDRIRNKNKTNPVSA